MHVAAIIEWGANVAGNEDLAAGLLQCVGGGRQLPVRAPFDARIAGVNASVIRNPSLVKSDVYGAGWLVALTPADGSFSALPQGEAAEGWLRKESARWTRFLEERLGFQAADGGELLAPAPWLIGEEGWSALASAFLTV